MAQDIRSMREDAIRRAREMYSRASPLPLAEIAIKEENDREEKLDEVIPENEVCETEDKNDIISDLLKDKDKMLIVSLLVILSQDCKDNATLFALVYLLL